MDRIWDKRGETAYTNNKHIRINDIPHIASKT